MKFAITVLLATAAVPALAAPDVAKLAADYGAREAAWAMRLSPSGDKIVYLAPAGTEGTAAVVVDIAAGTSKVVMQSKGTTFNLRYCEWKSDERVICLLSAFGKIEYYRTNFTRAISVKADGTGAIELGPHIDSRDLSVYNSSGYVIDWLPDDPQHVLMMVGVPQRESVGTMIDHSYGLSVQSVDVSTGKMAIVQAPKPDALEFGTDDHGHVRFMATGSKDADGYQRDAFSYAVRAKGSKEWVGLGSSKLSGLSTIDFHGFDETGDWLYMTRDEGGHTALFRQAADASGRTEPVFARPDVDISGVLRIGKYSRPVAAEYTADAEEYHYFDETLAKRSAALSKALPGRPPVSILDESWDGRYNLIAAGGINDPGAFYRFDTQTKQLGALLPLRPQMAAYKAAAQTSVTYTTSDGAKVPAFLTMPPSGPAKGLPAIVMPHGGPSARDRLGFDWLAQYYAQLGYAVLQPNYRGSTGYGAAWYASNGFKSWKLAIGDINDGARWLIAQGIADPAKMTAVGWSYGGYAVLQASVVAPTLYKAIVAIAPVTDLNLLRDNARFYSDYQQIINEVGVGDHVTAGSPARNAERIAAPVLIFQGDKDTNVEPRQAEVMDAALTSAHKKHQLVMYKGLDHYLTDSTARADMLTKSANWLADAIGH